MALINDIETVRAYGVKVMFINSDDSLADITAAEQRFLVPVLGNTLYDTVSQNAAAPTDEYKTIVDLCKRVVAPLAYWIELPFLQVSLSSKGLGTFSSENMQAAHRWEYEQYREALADKGCHALELLLWHLFDNKAKYSWDLPAEYKGTFFTGKEFSKYYTLYQPYRTFENLRPLVRQVEDQYIKPTIGDDFFDELLGSVIPANPSDDQKKITKAIDLLKKAVANYTIKTAIEVLPVKLSVSGFTVLLEATEKTNQGEEAARESLLDKMYASVGKTGDTYLLQLKEYLNTNASDTLFTNFKNSAYYKAPVAAGDEINPNACSKIFSL